jgi:hypothetical protein
MVPTLVQLTIFNKVLGGVSMSKYDKNAISI